MNYAFSKESVIEGLILPFDKPYHWTSFDMVNKIRKILTQYTGIKKLKVGHAGTLDPLATGLLIVCTGLATKKIISFQNLSKVYDAEITFGATTPSFDLETEVDHHFSVNHIDLNLIQDKVEKLKGTILQEPPLFSAKKFDGKRAYELARNGVEKKLNSVEVQIHSIDILAYESPVLKLRLVCSKGTYIRAFARDLGILLDSGGYLSNLRRTAIGEYSVDSALSVEDLKRSLNIL